MSNANILRKQIKEAKAKLTKMREHKTPSLGVAYLIESDLDKASVLLSAEAIGGTFQDMAEKIARVEANDLIPMDKAMKAQFGEESANRFYQAVQTVLRGLLDQLKTAQDSIDKEVESLRSGTPGNDMANAPDIANPADPEPEAPAPEAPEMPDMGDGADMADDGGDMADDGGDEAPAIEPEPALGRDRKMSETISDKRIVKAFVVEMKKTNDAERSARKIAEKFSVDVSDVKTIIREASKR